VPIIGQSNAVPFVHQLTIDLAARTDRYSGTTMIILMILLCVKSTDIGARVSHDSASVLSVVMQGWLLEWLNTSWPWAISPFTLVHLASSQALVMTLAMMNPKLKPKPALTQKRKKLW